DVTSTANPLSVAVGKALNVQANFAARPAYAGVFRQGFLWVLDIDGNQQMNIPPDLVYAYGGIPGDIPITGDWNGDGHTKIGIYRPGNGLFILDTNGNGVLDAGDAVFNLHIGKSPGDVPVVGDWNGDGRSKVGYFRQGFLWILDTNGNHVFEQGIDQVYAYGGVAGDIPVVGDWTGTGISKVGVFRQGFLWVLDANGNHQIDAPGPGGDYIFGYGGIPGDIPVVGKWSPAAPQFQNDNGAFVDDIYIGLLGRAADPGGWAGWTGGLNARSSRDATINALLSSSEYLSDRNTFQANNGYGCGWPSDANGQFLIMLYRYALNRCPTGYPSSGEYLYWEKVLGQAATKSSVVQQIIYGGEFQGDYGASVISFL